MKNVHAKLLSLLAIMMLSEWSSAQEILGSSSLAEVFQRENVEGTMIVASSDGEILYSHNANRARERLSPASTFKIINTLIALDHGVVDSPQSPFEWDGTERGVAAWNQDQTLRTAFKVSCVWCYQEIARKVGMDRYRSVLAEIGYGNQQLGEQVDQFWLNGQLKISAVEQVDFLSRLLSESTLFRAADVAVLKSIMRDDDSPSEYTIYAKTGWTGSELAVGWFVGYVEKDKDVWLFAMNMRMSSAEQASLRRSLTIKSLQALGLI